MAGLSIADRYFVIHKRLEGHGYGAIVTMLKNRGTTITRTSVKKLWKNVEFAGLFLYIRKMWNRNSLHFYTLNSVDPH